MRILHLPTAAVVGWKWVKGALVGPAAGLLPTIVSGLALGQVATRLLEDQLVGAKVDLRQLLVQELTLLVPGTASTIRRALRPRTPLGSLQYTQFSLLKVV